jgi:uncharacterized protein YjbJ (UPF0337 family)
MASQSDRLTGYGPPAPEDRPSDPDAIRREIERTRAELAGDVDRLADRTSPKRVARRNWERLGRRFGGMKESLMGTPRSAAGSLRDTGGSAAGSMQQAAGSVKDAAGSAADAVRDAPHKVARQTRGNPLAVGLVAFGAGLVAASLIPPTEAERQAGERLADQTDGLMEKVKQPLREVKQDMTDSARESAQQMKETARDAAQSTAASTKETARDTADSMKQS